MKSMLRFPKAVALTSASLVALATGPVGAQWFGRGMNSCDCAPPLAAPAMSSISSACGCDMPTVTAVSACAPVVQTVQIPLQPVMQTVYQQVPVTEYQAVKQTVQRQVMETKYVDQAITAYRPVTETRMAEVPTVSYQDVTEYQTVMKNAGFWRTRYEPVAKLTPCQYDSRPGMIGWMNRTNAEVRNAFTPNQVARREYCPQCVAQQVATTRRVAINGTRQVAYNVTRMEAYQTTQKVAVAVPRTEAVEVTVMKPVTIVKTMAVGTQVTYQPMGAAGTATALQPQPDAIGRGTIPSRTATNKDELDKANPARRNGSGASLERSLPQRERLVPTAMPRDNEVVEPKIKAHIVGRAESSPAKTPAAFKAPTAARVNQWVARTPKSPASSPEPSALSVADSERP